MGKKKGGEGGPGYRNLKEKQKYVLFVNYEYQVPTTVSP